MTDRLFIFLLNKNYEIIEKTNMERPKSFMELLKKIKISLPSLPKVRSQFELFIYQKKVIQKLNNK